MRFTEESERNEMQDASRELLRARKGLAEAADAAATARAGRGHPLTDAHERQWIRVALAQRREDDAIDAHVEGHRRRARTARFRAIVGLPPREAPEKEEKRDG